MSTHGKSYRLIAKGGQTFWDKMREASQGIVFVLTDDVERHIVLSDPLAGEFA